MTTLTEMMCPECMVPTELVQEVQLFVDVPVVGAEAGGSLRLSPNLDPEMVTDVVGRGMVRCCDCGWEFDEAALVTAHN